MHVKPYRGLATFDDVWDYVSVTECARRMSITPEQVVALVKSGALRHLGGAGSLWVEPAVLV